MTKKTRRMLPSGSMWVTWNRMKEVTHRNLQTEFTILYKIRLKIGRDKNENLWHVMKI